MTPGPFERFLGVDETADPRTLLGLPPGSHDRQRIHAALIDRLEQLHRHPDGQSAEAESVRGRLREAAAALLAESAGARPPEQPVRPRSPREVQATPAPPVRPLPPPRDAARRQLTEFDRQVLAVLVGSGGWNATSRARLVALADSYGVTAGGLMKVVTGLSDYARSGGPRLEVGQMTSRSWRLEPRARGAVRIQPAATKMAQVGERLSEELSGRSLWSTVRLSAFFGILTLIVGIIAVRAALHVRPSVPTNPQARVPLQPSGPAQPAGDSAQSAEAEDGPGARLARFQPLPTFLGNALPLEATEAADRCPELPEMLDSVARRISITDEPSEAVYRDWAFAIDTIATGWVLADESTRAAIDNAIDDVLFEVADKPSVGDRLLEVLLPPAGRIREPVEVWRGAWLAGTLGSIGGSTHLPPAVSQRARNQLAVTLEGSPPATTDDFTAAAAAWLARALEGLVDALEYDPNAYDVWEMWIAAQRELGDDDRFNNAIMRGVRRILQTDTDLARTGPSVNVLGRLLLIADFRQSAVVKDAVAGLFDAPVEDVGADDLWVLTSLLAQSDTAPWFGEDLVLPEGTGKLFRNRIRDRIADRWPPIRRPDEQRMAEGRGVDVDARVARRWVIVRRALPAQPGPTGEEELMARLLIACRLNEAAALLATRAADEAEAVLGQIDAALVRDETAGEAERAGPGPSPTRLRSPGGLSAPARRGRPVGSDGEWASAYASAQGNTEEELKWLSALRASDGTDLGPIDAEVFVHEVYLGSPPEVRSLARSLLTQLFIAGPNVAMEMLDQYPDAPRNRGVSETIASYTGRVLPPAGTESWQVEARLALLHHALSLHPSTGSVVDDLSQLLVESYARRITAQGQDPALSLALRSPQEAAGHLADVWRNRAAALVASRALPDDLAGLQRRREMRIRLAEGPIQRLVAEQLTVLDYLTYVTVAEQPGLYDVAQRILAESAASRAGAGHVLQQAIEAEEVLSRIWALRMNLADEANTGGEGDR
jgi:hypothetical protein